MLDINGLDCLSSLKQDINEKASKFQRAAAAVAMLAVTSVLFLEMRIQCHNLLSAIGCPSCTR